MARVHLVGDPNSAGGLVSSSLQTGFRVNGKPVSVNGSPVTPHPPFVGPHATTVTANGATGFRINGIPVNREGDGDSCGHSRAGVSQKFKIEEI